MRKIPLPLEMTLRKASDPDLPEVDDTKERIADQKVYTTWRILWRGGEKSH